MCQTTTTAIAATTNDEGGSKTSNTSTLLFDRLGGVEVVRMVVDNFYYRLTADDRLAFFFEDKKMAMLKQHQVQFLKVAFTGGFQGTDVDPIQLVMEKHRRLFINKGLNETHFDMVADHLVATLNSFQVSQNLIDEAAQIVLSLRPAFVNGPAHYLATAEAKEQEESSSALPNKNNDDVSDPPTSLAAGGTTLMDKLGGSGAVKAAVEGLYQRVLADEELAPFFQEASMTALKLHMIKFMVVAFTQVPEDMDVPGYIAKSHAPLFQKGLNGGHFDLVVSHLVATLTDLTIPTELIQEAAAVVLPLRPVFEEGAAERK